MRIITATKTGLVCRRTIRLCLLLGGMLSWAGCSADVPLNPSFPLTLADAKLALQEMEKHPKKPAHPIVVLGGIYDPGIASVEVARRIRRLVDAEDLIISVSFLASWTFDQCRARVIEKVNEAFPSDEPGVTTEVDVIAISMGGLVARYAAKVNADGDRRLQINRLFTISTPHRGAKLAWLPTFDSRIKDMKIGSPFLDKLDESWQNADYEIYPYARLDDSIVGSANTAPTGRHPWWVANIPGSFSHVVAMFDQRFLADIARRLRSEAPFTHDPPAPLP